MSVYQKKNKLIWKIIRIENYKNPKGEINTQKGTCYFVGLAKLVFRLCFELSSGQSGGKYGFRIHSI